MAYDPDSLYSGRIEPALNPVIIHGLDLSRSRAAASPGVFMADPATSFLAGQVLALNSLGNLDLCTGTNPFGIAKWNFATVLSAIIQEQSIVLSGTSAVNLQYGNVSQVLVTDVTGTIVYAVTTDYTVSAVNGTITRVSSGAITDGETVLVSYRYQVPNSALQFEGRNFFNFIDDVSQAQGRVALLQGPGQIFTAAYNTGVQYAVNQPLYCGADGNLTNVSGTAQIGFVVQTPTADDPYLGFQLQIP